MSDDLLLDEEELPNSIVSSLSWDPFTPTRFISSSGPTIKLWDINMDQSVLSLKQQRSTY